MDGVGGTIKNLVFCAVKSGKVSVGDPEEFAKAANDIAPSIRSLYMPIEDMLEEPAEVVNTNWSEICFICWIVFLIYGCYICIF